MLIKKYLRNFYMLFVFIFLSLPLPVRAVQYWGDGIFADFGFSSKSSLPSKTPLEGSVGIRVNPDKSSLFMGTSIDDFGFNIAGSVEIIPLKVNFFSLGFQYLTNLTRSFVFEDKPDLITWGNVFLLTMSFAFGKDKNNPLIIEHNIGVNKHQSFLKLTNNRLELQEVSVSAELQLTKRFLNRHEIMFRLANFDTFLLQGIFNLWWQLGYSLGITKSFTLGLITEVMYTDQVLLSGAMSGIQAKVFGAYKL